MANNSTQEWNPNNYNQDNQVNKDEKDEKDDYTTLIDLATQQMTTHPELMNQLDQVGIDTISFDDTSKLLNETRLLMKIDQTPLKQIKDRVFHDGHYVYKLLIPDIKGVSEHGRNTCLLTYYASRIGLGAPYIGSVRCEFGREVFYILVTQLCIPFEFDERYRLSNTNFSDLVESLEPTIKTPIVELIKHFIESPMKGHPDFHPGNIVVLPNGKLGAIDFDSIETQLFLNSQNSPYESMISRFNGHPLKRTRNKTNITPTQSAKNANNIQHRMALEAMRERGMNSNRNTKRQRPRMNGGNKSNKKLKKIKYLKKSLKKRLKCLAKKRNITYMN